MFRRTRSTAGGRWSIRIVRNGVEIYDVRLNIRQIDCVEFRVVVVQNRGNAVHCCAFDQVAYQRYDTVVPRQKTHAMVKLLARKEIVAFPFVRARQ